MTYQAIVIGAGFAGLSAARELGRRRVDAIVLERSRAVGQSWRSRHEHLRLNTWRVVSRLPGSALPRRAGRWPHRDDLVAHLEGYAVHEGLSVRTGIDARSIDRVGAGWRVETSAGHLEAPVVVVATGHDRVPVVPDWPGKAGYLREFLHSSAYRSARPFRGRDVLVVGAGNSGSEIAADLASGGARRVRLAVRTGVNLFGPSFLGIPITVWAYALRAAPSWFADVMSAWTQRLRYGDLAALGVVPAPWGVATEMRVKGKGPVLDRGFSDAIRSGTIEIVRAVAGFDGPDVVLASGERLHPDAVIAATGYRTGLETLVGDLVDLDRWGRPACRDTGIDPRVPGLYFVGYALPLTGQLPEMACIARRVARHAEHLLRRKRDERPEQSAEAGRQFRRTHGVS
ncbi:MAG TPA: NAD(P)/FAD-dependent oxidoreductase [Vicinamibacterales bacterium]|nr:NAD(P)/FAD-dependent oxidoreductase [Vicinamibacterales bacterium]